MNSERVLVTGGSGFVGAHCLVQLLDAGYRVRTTVRSRAHEQAVRDILETGGARQLDKLSFVAADLSSDQGWAEAVADCDFVLHVALPLASSAPKHEDDLIIPAREGTLRVLRAARDAGVGRVVLTSSLGAISHGAKGANRTFSEADWTDTNSPISAMSNRKRWRSVRPGISSRARAGR